MPRLAWGVGQTGSFSAWTLTNLTVDTDGSLIITSGQTSGSGISPVTQCASWQHYSTVSGSGSRPTGTNILFQFRAGSTEAACAAASWSPYFDTWDALGAAVWDALEYFLNNGTAPDGAFFQIQVSMYSE